MIAKVYRSRKCNDHVFAISLNTAYIRSSDLVSKFITNSSFAINLVNCLSTNSFRVFQRLFLPRPSDIVLTLLLYFHTSNHFWRAEITEIAFEQYYLLVPSRQKNTCQFFLPALMPLAHLFLCLLFLALCQNQDLRFVLRTF